MTMWKPVSTPPIFLTSAQLVGMMAGGLGPGGVGVVDPTGAAVVVPPFCRAVTDALKSFKKQ